MSTTALRTIGELARELSIPDDALEPYGRSQAKVDPSRVPASGKKGRLILVSAINPTPAGEGKTTTSIGLAMAMAKIGKKAILALREPSLGPVFGVKGGGTGGGRASLYPADRINLHFTGDLHAITSANNLLSAIVDNALHFNTPLGDKGRLDARQVTWARALDMNDRALRNVIVGLGQRTDGMPRQERFDITAASEVMAILAMARDLEDLQARLARVVVGTSDTSQAVTAEDLGASTAMAALLKDAILPNLVQTLEGTPALVHAGPFANIAHGCSSVAATSLALRLADYVVTEAGFGFDLGGEKFLDIKCRAMGEFPRLVVLVATLRALKMHGGVSVKEAGAPNAEALERGLSHLARHVDAVKRFGLPVVVAVNAFPQDNDEERAIVARFAEGLGVPVAHSHGFAKGGDGALDLARIVAEVAEGTDASPPRPKHTYELDEPFLVKMEKIARNVYGARNVALAPKAERDLARFTAMGYANLPICVAKTQLSLTDDPAAVGSPEGFDVTVRELRLSAGAGFLVALLGQMMTMPGLPKEPAARGVRIEADGRIRGLMQND